MKFVITALVKVRDVVEVPDDLSDEAAVQAAKMLFKTKYPAMLDKQSSFIDVKRLPKKDKRPR